MLSALSRSLICGSSGASRYDSGIRETVVEGGDKLAQLKRTCSKHLVTVAKIELSYAYRTLVHPHQELD